MYEVSPVFRRNRITRSKSPKMGEDSPHHHHEFCAGDDDNDHLNWEWYNPNEDSIPVSFCMNSSLHGLQYLGQQKRHIFERFFWLAAFIASMTTAVVLICGMWRNYREMPIITMFNPTEKNLDEIPFPGVTICNVNTVQDRAVDKYFWKSVTNGLGKHYFGVTSSNETTKDIARIIDISHICDSVKTFTDRFVGNTTFNVFQKMMLQVKKAMFKAVDYVNPMESLRKVAQPCSKMILHCVWLEEVQNCEELFQEIETDYGYCCTFNTVPMSLLLKNFTDTKNQSEEVLMEWKDADLDYENLLFTKETEDRLYPYRQKYPGRSSGLSFLLNPELHEYFCTNTDSQGFIMGVNVPLDFPRMKDNGIAIQTDSEVFVGIKPDITMSHRSIKSFSVEKRQCYYGNEYTLPHYTKYTVSNCMSECIARKTVQECNCTKYYLPRDETDKLCKPESYECTDEVRRKIVTNGLSKECTECLPTCTEIEYNKEITTLRLQEKKIKQLFEVFPPPEHAKNALEKLISIPQTRKVSIVHVYFSTNSVHPKLRREFTTITELLSNAGGLLGLCMGFSVLSLLEIVYYGSLRLWCSIYREKTIQHHKAIILIKSCKNSNKKDISIHHKPGWFERIFDKACSLNDIPNKEKTQVIENDIDGYINIDDVFKRGTYSQKLPDRFEDQFQNALKTAFPNFSK